MRMTLLGVGEAFDPAEPNSAALIEAEGFTLLIDCGHSAVPPLWRARPHVEAIDAIYVTHLHADHVVGLIPVLDRWAALGRQREVVLLSAPEAVDPLRRLLAAGGQAIDAIRFVPTQQPGRIGPFAFRTAPTAHAVPNHAILLEHAGRRLAWSGDGRPTPHSRALFEDAHLLMHECYDAAASDLPFHCDLPTVRTIAGPARIGLYHAAAGTRPALRAAVEGDARLFVPEAGAVLEV